jgi:hypothetical protein
MRPAGTRFSRRVHLRQWDSEHHDLQSELRREGVVRPSRRPGWRCQAEPPLGRLASQAESEPPAGPEASVWPARRPAPGPRYDRAASPSRPNGPAADSETLRGREIGLARGQAWGWLGRGPYAPAEPAPCAPSRAARAGRGAPGRVGDSGATGAAATRRERAPPCDWPGRRAAEGGQAPHGGPARTRRDPAPRAPALTGAAAGCGRFGWRSGPGCGACRVSDPAVLCGARRA